MKRLTLKLIGLSMLLCLSLKSMAGGFMLVNSGHANPYIVEHKSLRVNAEISNKTALTSITQIFCNNTAGRLEVFFCFPVPKGSVLSNFSMSLDGKELKAELLDAAKARGIYEEIVRKQKDPALLEYVGMDLYKVRIFPFEPHSEKTLKITYSSLIEKDGGVFSYTLPLNTQKHSAVPLKDVSITLNINEDEKLKSIYCASHNVKINRSSDHKAQVSYESMNTKPDRDFTLYFNTDRASIGVSMLNYKEENEAEGVFYLDIAPGMESGTKEIAKDITFVIDVSGSMSGEKMEQAKKALKFCVNQLKDADRFDVISFSTEANSLLKDLKAATKENKKIAVREIDELEAIGGTNIDEALQAALKQGGKERPHFIVFITDGKPTIGEVNDKKLLQLVKDNNSSNKRIFTVGVGYDLNTHLLDEITQLTNAYRTYIGPEEDLEIKISDFYTKISSPVLTDIELDIQSLSTGKTDSEHYGFHKVSPVSVSKIFPKSIPDLFKGSSINLLGRYKGHGDATIHLKGKIDGKPVEYSYHVRFQEKNEKHSYLPSLWASRYIGYMLDEIRLRGESQELKDEITALAKKYGIITPYTSYLIIEDESRLLSNNTINPKQQLIRGRAMEAPAAFNKEREADYADMKKKEGARSVKASKRVEELNQNSSADGIANDKDSALAYSDNAGNSRNLAGDIRNVCGRAFYNNNNSWTDANVQNSNGMDKVKIKFASPQYYDLLDKYPDSKDYLALGRNVSFVMNNRLYEITE